MMTTTQVVETSVQCQQQSYSQDYVHPDDQTQPTFVLVYQLVCEYSRLYEERRLYSQSTTFSIHFKRNDDQMRRKIRVLVVRSDGKFKFVCHERHWHVKHVGE